MTTIVTYTPWGWTKDVVELAEGVWRVSTPSHGGLKLSRERWAELPAGLRAAMFTQTFAEEDCEEPIVRTLLGLGDDREREMALKVAGYFDRYAPALPHLRDCPPGHPLPRRRLPGRLRHRPLRAVRHPHRGRVVRGRRRDGAEAYGRMEASRVQPDAPALPGGRGRGHDRDDTAQAPQPAQHDDQAPARSSATSTSPSRRTRTASPSRSSEWLGKGGSFQHGVTELACRLISLHLRRGTPLEEVIDQCQGIQEMQPFFNQMPDGRSVAVLGLGDGIAHILKGHLKAREEREAERRKRRWNRRPLHERPGQRSRGGSLLRGRPRFPSTGTRRNDMTTETLTGRRSSPALRRGSTRTATWRCGPRRPWAAAAPSGTPRRSTSRPIPPSEESLTAMEAGNALEPVVAAGDGAGGLAGERPDPQDPQTVAVRIGPNMLVTGHPDGTVRMPVAGDEAPPQLFLFGASRRLPPTATRWSSRSRRGGRRRSNVGGRWGPSAATRRRWPRPPSTRSASSATCGTP